MNPDQLTYSLYIHIPFCRRRCSYCDFNTYAGLEAFIPEYVTALCREMAYLGAAAGVKIPVHTVYLGGGTPSLLSLAELERIFTTMREVFDLQPDAEISLEANPGTVDLAYLRGLRELGINRLSLGVQSAQGDELELLGRIHTFQEAIQAVEWARLAGFENLNLDLIFGLPGQPLDRWEQTLRHALALSPEHLSLYALTLEEGTPLQRRVAAGELPEPDPDLAADMYDLASEVLEGAAFRQYEISNWARDVEPPGSEYINPACACRHNLQYWRNLPYLGVGAGACGFIPMQSSQLLRTEGKEVEQARVGETTGSMRIANVFSPAEYIRRMAEIDGRGVNFPRTPAADQIIPIDLQAEIGETMMMGLRLTIEGVSRTGFRARFGQELDVVYGQQIAKLIGLGLLEWAGVEDDILRLTPRGRLLGNQVFVEFI